MKLLIGLLISILAFSASASIMSPLPSNDLLHKEAEDFNTELNDNLISTGAINVSAGQLESPNESLKALAAKGLAEAYKKNQGKNMPKVLVKITAGKLDGKFRDKMVAAIMDSNAYSNENSEARESLTKNVKRLFWRLQTIAETKVAHAQTTVLDDTTGEKVSVQYFILTNIDGKVVALFTVEGTI